MAEKLNKNSNQHWKNHNIPYNLRALCAQSIFSVIDQGKSLSTALSHYSHNINEKDKALMQEICFGALRVLPELEFYAQSLMEKVFTGKNRVIHHLILVGIYQILYTRVPEHAAASETVNGVVALKKGQLKPVINGVLRSFLRKKEELKLQFLQAGNTALHPNWLLKRIKQAYPDQWQEIIDANNQKPPMWLRVNRQHYSVEEYQKMLMDLNIESQKGSSDCAIRLLKPTAIHQLPRFENGVVTVQDLSAQKAVYLLDPQNEERILDMCAAPGGKTTHILEYAPNANVLAVDIDPLRVERIYENLNRLNLKAEVKVGDGLTPEKWCTGEQFDRILLDAPCSATGVIRRHPDIKWLRRDSDIAELVELQYRILNNIWSYLKPNGRLVYATCSILPDENRQQILRFLQEQPNAKLLGEMQQYIPEFESGDGFFYAVLQKISDY